MKRSINLKTAVLGGLLISVAGVMASQYRHGGGDSGHGDAGRYRFNDRVGLPDSAETALYREECGGCHVAYPPAFLPRESWQALMQGLDEHFGDNAELDADSQTRLQAYLHAHTGPGRGNGIHRLSGPNEQPLLAWVQQFRKQEQDYSVLIAEDLSPLLEQRARLAGDGLAGQRFDPQRDLADLLMLLERAHADRGIRFHSDIQDGVQPQGEREDLLELLGNLLDNAAKWARSRVRLEIRQDGDLLLRVCDDGPGLSGDKLAQLTQRGRRLDESVEGHGLGLAIVRDIVDLYGGTLFFESGGQQGGLMVSVRLPVASG